MAGIIDPVLLRDYLTVADTLVLIAVGTAIVLYHKYIIIPRIKTLAKIGEIITKDYLDTHCVSFQSGCKTDLKELILENRRLNKEQMEELQKIISVTVKAEILMAIDGKLQRGNK